MTMSICNGYGFTVITNDTKRTKIHYKNDLHSYYQQLLMVKSNLVATLIIFRIQCDGLICEMKINSENEITLFNYNIQQQ